MRFILTYLSFAVIMIMMNSLDLLYRYQTAINGLIISFPKSLLSINDGDYIVKIDDYEVNVKLQRENNLVQTSIKIPSELSDDLKYKSLPINSFVYEIVKSQAAKQSVLVASVKQDTDAFCAVNDSCEMVDWVTTCGVKLAPVSRLLIHQYNLLHKGIGALILDRNGQIFLHQRSSTKRLFPSMYDMFIGGVSSADESSLETLLRELKEEIGLDFSIATSTLNESRKIENENIIGKNKLFSTNELFENFLKNSSMTQNTKMNILKNEKNRLNENGNDTDTTNEIQYLGQTTIKTSYNHCIVDVYTVICNEKYSKNIVFQDGEICWGEWIKTPKLYDMLLGEEKEFVPDGLQVWNAIPGMVK